VGKELKSLAFGISMPGFTFLAGKFCLAMRSSKRLMVSRLVVSKKNLYRGKCE